MRLPRFSVFARVCFMHTSLLRSDNSGRRHDSADDNRCTDDDNSSNDDRKIGRAQRSSHEKESL